MQYQINYFMLQYDNCFRFFLYPPLYGSPPAKNPNYPCFRNKLPKRFFFKKKFPQFGSAYPKTPHGGVFGSSSPKTPFFRFWGVSKMNFRIMQKLVFFLCFS